MSDFLGLQYLHESLIPPDPTQKELREIEWEASLKRRALLFDRIGIYALGEDWESESERTNLIHWLTEQEVLFRASEELKPDFLKAVKPDDLVYLVELLEWYRNEVDRDAQKEFRQREQVLDKVIREMEKLKGKTENNPESSKVLATEKKWSKLIKELQEAKKFFHTEDQKLKRIKSTIIRVLARQMETLDHVVAIPLVSIADYSHEMPITSKNDVIEITINRLPLPGATTPWEAILDYRNDNDTRKSLRELRNWIRKTASRQLARIEVEDELESLIDEFHHHMKLHKLKADSETLQTLVKAPLNVIESLLHLRPTAIIDPLFVFQKRRISLMEAELNAPGKEIAYIFRTKAIFSDSE